jgi:hypothetical protein
MARRDFCPRVVCIHSKTKQKGGGQRVSVAGLLTNKRQNGHQNVIFDVMSGVQKDLEDISAETGKF